MDAALLSDAFVHFANASRSLEMSYALLQERIARLSEELDKKNKALEKALDEARENKDYLDAVLYNLEEAILVVDTDDRVTMCNRSAERLLSVRKASDMGKHYGELGFTLSREGSDVVLQVNGAKYAVMCSYSPVPGAHGTVRGKVILIKDITTLRELEVQHERNQRLISMGEMAAKIVHEIRNPLCSTELFATLLAREIDRPEHRTLAAGISEGISHMNRILSNMQYFARPHTCRLTKIDLREVVENSLRLIAPTLQVREVPVDCSLQPAEIRGDAELLTQALLNVVINALQASPAGGSIGVSLREEDGFAVLSVKDHGEGIRPCDREKIFDPFFSTKDKGTGLGLAITSKIIQAHGGYIKVVSEVGRGSVFSLCLPRGGAS